MLGISLNGGSSQPHGRSSLRKSKGVDQGGKRSRLIATARITRSESSNVGSRTLFPALRFRGAVSRGVTEDGRSIDVSQLLDGTSCIVGRKVRAKLLP